jgi:hypothetical protein
VFRSWEIDFDARTMRVELLDGSVAREPMTSEMAASSVVRRSRLDFGSRTLMLTLDDGETLEVDIGVPGQVVPTNVPIVHLDQLHWISLAQHLWAPDRLRESEREAAEVLVGLARERRVLLPVAAAHLTELPPAAGRRRRDLAVTVLGVSRGWQMQSPIRICAQEYLSAILGCEPVASDVFTLQPGVLFTEGSVVPNPTAGAPADLSEMVVRVTAVSAVYAAILDDETPDMREGKAAAERWAASFPPLARYMRERGMSEEDVRLNARARFIVDQTEELARAGASAGISPEQFAGWLADKLPEDVARMPHAARLSEVLYLRLRNADEKWEAHDLNDMNYICAAAGYADITVGEKKTIEYLRRAEPHLPLGSQICRQISEAVELLHARGTIL